MTWQQVYSSGLISGCHKRSFSLSTAPASKKYLVSKKTVQKWIRDNDKSLSTLTWLNFEMDAHGDGVSLLRCKICYKFKEITINEKLSFGIHQGLF